MSNASVKRHARAQRRLRRKPQEGLLLTALIDIFTNLLFFLLVLSQSPNKLPDSRDLKLPASVATADAKENLVVQITKNDILVQDTKIASVAEVAQLKDDTIPQLSTELDYRTKVATVDPKVLINGQTLNNRKITIMGDEHVPYNVLRKVMATCSQKEYGDITFAVIRGGKTS